MGFDVNFLDLAPSFFLCLSFIVDGDSNDSYFIEGHED
jgi:hypothetical protein